MLRKAERHRHRQKRRRGNAGHTGGVCRAWGGGGRVCRPKRLRRGRAYICRYCRGGSGAACMRAQQGGRSLRWGSVCRVHCGGPFAQWRKLYAYNNDYVYRCRAAWAHSVCPQRHGPGRMHGRGRVPQRRAVFAECVFCGRKCGYVPAPDICSRVLSAQVERGCNNGIRSGHAHALF